MVLMTEMAGDNDDEKVREVEWEVEEEGEA